MPTNTKPKQHAFATEAMMIRALHTYRSARDAAKNSGADVSADHEPPSYGYLTERYDRILDEWAPEEPDDITGLIAYLDLVAAIIDDERAERRGDRDAILSTERDLGHALQLLTTVRRWLNEQDINDLLKEERAKHPEVRTMLEALQRHGFDAELLALVAEYRWLEREMNTRKGKSDEEIERLSAELRTLLDKLDKVRPRTLPGVLAVLDLGSDLIDDPHWWPDEAIEGLREIAKREGGQ